MSALTIFTMKIFTQPLFFRTETCESFQTNLMADDWWDLPISESMNMCHGYQFFPHPGLIHAVKVKAYLYVWQQCGRPKRPGRASLERLSS